MSHGSDDSENYWPGYVDALTAMVQVLAFVMMLLALAVFVLSQSVTKHAVEAIAKAVNADVKPDTDVKQMTKVVMDQVSRLQASRSADQVNAEEKPPSASAGATPHSGPDRIVSMRVGSARPQHDAAPLQFPLDAPRLTLNFEDRSFRVEQSSTSAMTKLVDDSKVVEQGRSVVIVAYAYSGDGALSEARRLAYYRAMMARKQLVDAKVKPDTIRVNVTDTTDKHKGLTVEVVIADKSGT